MLVEKENLLPLNAFSLLGRPSNQKYEQNQKVVAKKTMKPNKLVQETKMNCQGKNISSQSVINRFFTQANIPSTKGAQGAPKHNEEAQQEQEKCTELQFSLVTADGEPFEPAQPPEHPTTTRSARKQWFDVFFGDESCLDTRPSSWPTPYASPAPQPNTTQPSASNLSFSQSEDPYSANIFRYLRSVEALYSPGPEHYWQQPLSPLTAADRSAAVRWVCSTCTDFGFGRHTAFLAVNLFDRYFECRTRIAASGQFPVSSRAGSPPYDLAMLASLYIAYKHSEVKNYEFWHVLGLNTHLGFIYSKAEVQATESAILLMLGFKLNYYGPKCFFDHLVTSIPCIKQAFLDDQESAEQFIEQAFLRLLDTGKIYAYQASKLAVGMVYILLDRTAQLNIVDWDTKIMPYSLYSENDAKESAKFINISLAETPHFILQYPTKELTSASISNKTN